MPEPNVISQMETGTTVNFNSKLEATQWGYLFFLLGKTQDFFLTLFPLTVTSSIAGQQNLTSGLIQVRTYSLD